MQKISAPLWKKCDTDQSICKVCINWFKKVNEADSADSKYDRNVCVKCTENLELIDRWCFSEE